MVGIEQVHASKHGDISTGEMPRRYAYCGASESFRKLCWHSKMAVIQKQNQPFRVLQIEINIIWCQYWAQYFNYVEANVSYKGNVHNLWRKNIDRHLRYSPASLKVWITWQNQIFKNRIQSNVLFHIRHDDKSPPKRFHRKLSMLKSHSQAIAAALDIQSLITKNWGLMHGYVKYWRRYIRLKTVMNGPPTDRATTNGIAACLQIFFRAARTHLTVNT